MDLLQQANGMGKVIILTGMVVWLVLSVLIFWSLILMFKWLVNFVSMVIGLSVVVWKHPFTIKPGHSKLLAIVRLSLQRASVGRMHVNFRREPINFVYNGPFDWKIVSKSRRAEDDGTE